MRAVYKGGAKSLSGPMHGKNTPQPQKVLRWLCEAVRAHLSGRVTSIGYERLICGVEPFVCDCRKMKFHPRSLGGQCKSRNFKSFSFERPDLH